MLDISEEEFNKKHNEITNAYIEGRVYGPSLRYYVSLLRRQNEFFEEKKYHLDCDIMYKKNREEKIKNYGIWLENYDFAKNYFNKLIQTLNSVVVCESKANEISVFKLGGFKRFTTLIEHNFFPCSKDGISRERIINFDFNILNASIF